MAVMPLQNMLKAPVITKIVSRVLPVQTQLSNFFSMGPGGKNLRQRPGKTFTYDVLDNSRDMLPVVSPNSPAIVVAPQVVGQGHTRALTTRVEIPISYEEIYNTRKLGFDFGNIDEQGQDYIAKQAEILSARARNLREFVISRVFRGKFYLNPANGGFTPADTQGTGGIEITMGVPAGNLGNLGGIVSALWSSNATDIPAQLRSISAKMEEDTGRPLRHAWINNVTWGHVLANTAVVAQSGSVNTAFFDWREIPGTPGADGKISTERVAELRCMPGLYWHIYDSGMNVSGSFAKFIPDARAAFCPDPSDEWIEGIEGSEIIVQGTGVNAPMSEENGMFAYGIQDFNPARCRLFLHDVFAVQLTIPKCIQYATVA